MGRSWLEIDEAAITRNTATMLRAASGARLCAVVKADGYGHGSVPAARAAAAGGATALAVARVEEGLQLRHEQVDLPIWVLSEPEPGEMAAAVAFNLEPTVYTSEGISAVARAARSQAARLPVHLSIDTGMHRVGVRATDAVSLATQIANEEYLELRSVWTHCASSDEPDNPLTNQQMDRLDLVLGDLAQANLGPPLVHAANSGGTLAFGRTHRDIVRCGISLYGLSPSPALADRVRLEPAMRWLVKVGFVKGLRAGDRVSYGQSGVVGQDTRVATLPVGYADGYRRSTWQGPGMVLIGGKPRPIVGVVTMDQMVVDVGDDPVGPGDEVVLLGRQGDAVITAEDLAQWQGTINYEVVCSPTSRVPKTYPTGA